MLDPDLTNILKRRIGASIIDLGIIGLISTIVWRTQLIAFPITDRDDITGEPLWTAAQQAQRDDIAEQLHTSFVFGDTSYVIDQSGLVLTALCAIVMALLAFVLIPANTGWSPGKRILGLAVIDAEGANPPLFDHLKRSMVGIIDALPVIIPGAAGWVVARSSEYHQRLGDRVADTYVIDNRNGVKFIDPSVYQRRTELRRATPVAAPVTDEMVEIGDRLGGASGLHREGAPELPASPSMPSEPVGDLPDVPDTTIADTVRPDRTPPEPVLPDPGSMDTALPNRTPPDPALADPAIPDPALSNPVQSDPLSSGLGAPAPPTMPDGALPDLPPPATPEVDPVGDPSATAPPSQSSLLPDLPPTPEPVFDPPAAASQVEPAIPLKAKDLNTGPHTTPAEPMGSGSPATEDQPDARKRAVATNPGPSSGGEPRSAVASDPASTSNELVVDPGHYEPSSAPMPTHRALPSTSAPDRAADPEPARASQTEPAQDKTAQVKTARSETADAAASSASVTPSGATPDWDQPVPEPAPVWRPGGDPLDDDAVSASAEGHHNEASPSRELAEANTGTTQASAGSERTDVAGEMVWNDQWQAWLFWDAEHEHWLRHDLDADRWIPIS